MPRTIRSAHLETRTQRLRLAPRRFHWRTLALGVHLGYRRGKAGFGSWNVRVLVDREASRYEVKRIGRADDIENADGREVLTYFQAQEKAREHTRAEQAEQEAAGPMTVARAAEDYLEWFRAHRKSHAETRSTIQAHVLPAFGRELLGDLTTKRIEKWHARLAMSAPRSRAPVATSKKSLARTARGERLPAQQFRAFDPDDAPAARRRKNTANRILTVFRALLNHAWRNGAVASDLAWRRVKPFRNVDDARVRFLSQDEARRLLEASPAEFARLVRAGLLTGCRYGELTELQVGDFHRQAGTIHVRDSKSGRPRHVPLTDEGARFFAELIGDRAAHETLFLRADRAPWGKNHQVRAMTAACAAAKIDPPVSFHVLRHTYGSWLAMQGTPLQVIAEAMGHSDTRITQKHYGHLLPSYVAQVIRANLPTLEAAAAAAAPPANTTAAKSKATKPAGRKARATPRRKREAVHP